MTTIRAIKEQITEILNIEATSANLKAYNPDNLNLRLKANWQIVLENIKEATTITESEAELVTEAIAQQLEEPQILESEGVDLHHVQECDQQTENTDYARSAETVDIYSLQLFNTNLAEHPELASSSQIVLTETTAMTAAKVLHPSTELGTITSTSISINPEPRPINPVVLSEASELTLERRLSSEPKLIKQIPETSDTTANEASLTVLYLVLIMLVAAFLATRWITYRLIEILVRYLLPTLDRLLTKSLLAWIEIIEYVFGSDYDFEASSSNP